MKIGTLWPRRIVTVQLVVILAFVNLVLPRSTLSASALEAALPIRIVAFGDSLTAGYGLPASAAFPVQLAKALKAKGRNVEIVNAGVSGDTTAAGLDRFDWAVPDNTEAVILELGANDALRGMAPKQARANLDQIIARLKKRNIEVLLAGMAAPRSLGDDYVAAFDRIYPELAQAHDLLLYPFFLDGVAARPGLNLDDGLHPTAKGIGVIVERIIPKVEELLTRVEARRTLLSKS